MYTFNIKDFLKRAAGFQTKELYFLKIVQDVIKKHINLEVPLPSIKIKSSLIQLKGISQSARSVLFIKKSKIIEDIMSQQDIHIIKDIR